MGEHVGRRSHQGEQRAREPPADEAERHRDQHTERDGLHTGPGGTLSIAFPDASRHDGRRANRQARRHRVDNGQKRLRQTDRGDGVGAEAGHEEHVHDCEDRLERQLEDHGDGEQQNGPSDGTLGVVPIV